MTYKRFINLDNKIYDLFKEQTVTKELDKETCDLIVNSLNAYEEYIEYQSKKIKTLIIQLNEMKK